MIMRRAVAHVCNCSNRHHTHLLSRQEFEIECACYTFAAVDASEFQPDPSLPRPKHPGDPVTVVALSRLVYRKGIDILALVIPDICQSHPHVRFIIGGYGYGFN